MNKSAMTIHDDRPISDREIEVVSWLLENASVRGSLQHLQKSIPQLRIVGRCSCGCASVDFETDGQAGGSRPIADAIAETAAGLKSGLILWGRDDSITGLEVYELDPGTANDLPAIEMLRAWTQPNQGVQRDAGSAGAPDA